MQLKQHLLLALLSCPMILLAQNTKHKLPTYHTPADQTITIPVQLVNNASIVIKITDISGKEMETIQTNNRQTGLHKEIVSTKQFPSGMYFYSVYQNGLLIGTRKFIIKH